MNNHCINLSIRAVLRLLVLPVFWLSICNLAQAFPLMFPDTRSAAMGSTGVASDPRNAVFHNPALLATSYEEYEWYAIAPLYQEVVADPDNLDNGLQSFLTAANELFSNPTEENRQQTRAALLQLQDKTYRERNAKMVLLGVPSELLSGAFYISSYQVFTAQMAIDDTDYNTIGGTVNSTVDYKGVKVTEMGFSSALAFYNGLLGEYKMGASLKLQLVDGLGYRSNVEQSELALNDNGKIDRTSAFNFDFGFSKEVGVWKFGLALQNAVKVGVDLGDSGESFNIEPQLKAGMAYRSRKTYFEVDADVLPIQQFGVEEKSRFLAAGWEYSLVPWLFLRAGAQHDLGGNNFTTYSYGIGLDIAGFEFDAAATSNEEEEGLYGQLTLKF